MIRFICRVVNRDQGHVKTDLVTVEAEVPALEKMLLRGGYGSGPDGDDFEYGELIGAEVIKTA